VAVESLRSDVIYQWHQGKEILPNINGLARNGVQLTRAYSQSTHSDYADPCLVSSLYPLRALRHHYYGPRDPWPVTRIYDVLKPLGYSTAIISSQNEAWGGMDHFLQSQHLDLFLHPETRPADTMVADRDPGFAREVRLGGLVAGKFPDAYTADQAIAWIREQAAADKPFFLSMNLQSSHFPYLMPDHVPRPFQPARLSSNVSFVDYPPEETETVRNAYFNAIHECDRQIGRLVAALTELQKLDNTILVVTGENGEAFHECGSVTHASNPVEPAIHVACVIHAPKFLEARVEDYPFEHVDLVPTVLGITEEGLAELGTTSQDVASQGVAGPETAALGVAELDRHPNFQGINIFSVERPALDERLLFCHVLSSLAEADSVLLAGRWKLTHDYRSNEQSLYDVVDDPGQTRNLISTHDQIADRLRAALAEWRQRQLAYYQHPAYYLNYYPPPPPRN
jgi:arylsulfatase A-like enzyme